MEQQQPQQEEPLPTQDEQQQQQNAPPHPPGDDRRLIADVLRRSERIPAMPSTLPLTVRALLHEWQDRRLGEFEQCNKRHWQPRTRQQYSKRLYFYKRIAQKAQTYRGTVSYELKLARAATELDHVRSGRTMAAFLRALKVLDPETRRRNRGGGVGG